MICLLCDTAIATLKKLDADQHYATHKDHKYFKLEEKVWKVVSEKLKDESQKQRHVISSSEKPTKNAAETIFKVAYILWGREAI